MDDDALDELLGDIDIDAAIAASGKIAVSALAPQRAPSCSLSSTASRQEQTTDEVAHEPEQSPRLSTHGAQAVRGGLDDRCLNADREMTKPSRMEHAAKGPGGDGESAPVDAVDDAMIANLMHGLDDSDLGCI
jgi:hypothetical protein